MGGVSTMAELDAARRKRIKKSDFAYVDKEGKEHLPIHDESHVRNAASRWSRTRFESADAKESARKKIVRAAKKHGIELSQDDKVMKKGRAAK
jgi:hypothetical protein